MAFDPVSSHHQNEAPLAGPRLDALLLDFSMGTMASAINSFGTLGRAILFAAAARACGPFEAGGGRPARPVSINALAASLRRPFETTRRNANALIEQGLLARAPGGLHMPIQALTDINAASFADQCHDLLVRVVEDAGSANMALPTPRRDIAYDPRLGVGIAFDLFLSYFECREGDDRHLMRAALLTAVEWGGLRATRRGRSDGAPVPVKPATVARTLGLPYATVARNLELLVREGILERGPDGIVVSEAQYIACGDARLAFANRARQLIGRLAQTGFDMSLPASGYIRGRPTLPGLN